jgi:hypothetical protein
MILQELKITRVAEAPLQGNLDTPYSPNFNTTEQNEFIPHNSFRDLKNLEYNPALTPEEKNDDYPSEIVCILWNPVRKEAIATSNVWSYLRVPFGTSNERTAKCFSDPEWRKDARIIIYRVERTGRRGLASFDVNLDAPAQTDKP